MVIHSLFKQSLIHQINNVWIELEVGLQDWIIDQKSTWMLWRYFNCQNWSVETIQSTGCYLMSSAEMLYINVNLRMPLQLYALNMLLVQTARVNSRAWSYKWLVIWRSDLDRKNRLSRERVLGPLHIKRKEKQTEIPWCYCGSNILIKINLKW